MIIQMTGLSGAGKSTLAMKVSELLTSEKIKIEIIDGDIYRQNICKDLGFSKPDRIENIRRLGFIANILSKHGIVAIIAAINPFEQARIELSQKYNAKIIYVKCDLETLITRDTKGLYKRALLPVDNPERLSNLTGVGDVFEEPENPDLTINTALLTIDESVATILKYIKKTYQNSQSQ